MTLRHQVLLELDDVDNDCLEIKQSLQTLSDHTEGCSQFKFSQGAKSSSHVLFLMDFLSEKDRDNYLVSDEHVKVATEVIIPKLRNGLQSAKVLDYVLNNTRAKNDNDRAGYAFVNSEKQQQTWLELALHVQHIDSLNIIRNISREELAKDYPYVIQINLSHGAEGFVLENATIFWGS
jgi:hypothetical protein